MTANLYEILGVRPDAENGQIIRAYRNLSKKHHPDVGGSPEQFQQLAEAMRVLTDKDARAHYDQTGKIRDPKDPDPTEAQAHRLISTVMVSIIRPESGDLATFDLIAALRKEIQSSIGKAKQGQAIRTTLKTRIGLVRRRIRKKEAGDNAICKMLDWHLQEMERADEASVEAIEVGKRALAILDGYSYDYQAEPVFTTSSSLPPFYNTTGPTAWR